MTWRSLSARPNEPEPELVPVPETKGQDIGISTGNGNGNGNGHGTAVQVEPGCNPCSKRLIQLLKLRYDETLSNFAFKSNLRRYNVGMGSETGTQDWRRRVNRS